MINATFNISETDVYNKRSLSLEMLLRPEVPTRAYRAALVAVSELVVTVELVGVTRAGGGAD